MALAQDIPGMGTWERELVIDPSTGLLLADQQIVVRPGPDDQWAQPGLRIAYRSIVQAGWTDATPPAPAG